MNAYVTICLAVAIAALPSRVLAQSQNEFAAPAQAPSAMASPRPSENTLELAPAYGPQLPAAPPPLQHVEIPSPFIGCWEGNPDGFDSVVNSAGGITVGKPGRIVFCYRPTRIDVPTAKLAMGAGDWIKNFAWHFGLGLTLPRVDEAGIRTEIYAVTATQIHARAFIPLKGVELVFWVIPTPLNQILTDEEIVTLKDPGTTSVVARQELDIGGWMKSLRYWHADFHRIPDPPPAD